MVEQKHNGPWATDYQNVKYVSKEGYLTLLECIDVNR